MKTDKIIAIGFPLTLILGFFAGRANGPVRKEVVQYEYSEESKGRYAESLVIASARKETSGSLWRTRHIYYPTGQIIIEAEGTHHATLEATNSQAAASSGSHENRKSESLHAMVRSDARERPTWSIGAIVTTRSKGLFSGKPTPEYGVIVERRLFGPIWGGVSAHTDGTVGAQLKVLW